MTAPARITQADIDRAAKAVKTAGFERARNALTAHNQIDRYGQPPLLTDAGPPSPARALSNLSGGIPGSGISFATPSHAAQVMG